MADQAGWVAGDGQNDGVDEEGLVEALRSLGGPDRGDGSPLDWHLGTPPRGGSPWAPFHGAHRARGPPEGRGVTFGIREGRLAVHDNSQVGPGGQVDLNDERNLGDLEDPTLVEHMRRARVVLAGHDRIGADAPGIASLTAQDAGSRRALSTVTRQLNDGGMSLRCACDDVLVQATNLGRLIAGEAIHGFPATNRALPKDSAIAQNLAHMAKKIGEVGTALENLAIGLQGLERDLTLTRRGYEQVVDGLRLRHDNLEAALREAEARTGLAGGTASASAGASAGAKNDVVQEGDGF